MTPIEVARTAVSAGADVVLKYWNDGVEMRSKESYNLVSDADIEAEHAIVAAIRNVFPDHAVLGEEEHADDVNSPDLWIIDPIDGTNNFAHHVPHFGISVAYYNDGKAVCGVVLNPVTNDHFEATCGRGATQNGTAIQVGRENALNEVLIGVGFYYDRGAMMRGTLAAVEEFFGHDIHGIRRLGTASLDLCMVANGNLGAFFEYQLSPWDFAAGRLILEEAGGTITNCQGGNLPLKKTSVLASNSALHADALEIVRRHETLPNSAAS